jgi:hypothetical protein
VDRIEPGQVEPVGVGLDELERVAGLWLDVHANDVEPCAVVAHRGTTGA